jgi:hypothetical protein
MVIGIVQTDETAWWIVAGPHGKPMEYRFGQKVNQGDAIRLVHVKSGRCLHSHGDRPSPVTRQQEVTSYRLPDNGDNGDNWKIELFKGRIWTAGVELALQHIDTSRRLHSHLGKIDPALTNGGQEVTCFDGMDDNNRWRTSVGRSFGRSGSSHISRNPSCDWVHCLYHWMVACNARGDAPANHVFEYPEHCPQRMYRWRIRRTSYLCPLAASTPIVFPLRTLGKNRNRRSRHRYWTPNFDRRSQIRSACKR